MPNLMTTSASEIRGRCWSYPQWCYLDHLRLDQEQSLNFHFTGINSSLAQITTCVHEQSFNLVSTVTSTANVGHNFLFLS